jgi:(1->4)-alpha-D-glucan 1-alpha-D-glucosylmutase
MLATSTHDTKRSEDVRMRIASLSEMPDQWKKALQTWSKLNKKHRALVEDAMAPSRNEEYLIYQTLLGTWPLQPFSDEERVVYRERIQQYMLKALKEAKLNSSWTEANEPWENAVAAFIEKVLDPTVSSAFLVSLEEFAAKVSEAGAINSLAEVILKCTSPGVPDIYQGTEIWDLSLVDPDNRRAVDYPQRRQMLRELESADVVELLADWKSGRIKLLLLQKLLRFRREHMDLFSASYEPVAVSGLHAERVIAFERKGAAGRLLVLVPRASSILGFAPVGAVWDDTRLSIDVEGVWTDVLAGEDVRDLSAQVASLLARLPFAVLYRAA